MDQEARVQHAPREERYPSDVTDAEWAIISPIPPPRRGGRHRETDMREVMNAVRYVLHTGCQWRQLPKDFPPRSTVYNYFWEWTRYGVLRPHPPRSACEVREMEGRSWALARRCGDDRIVNANQIKHLDGRGKPDATTQTGRERCELVLDAVHQGILWNARSA